LLSIEALEGRNNVLGGSTPMGLPRSGNEPTSKGLRSVFLTTRDLESIEKGIQKGFS